MTCRLRQVGQFGRPAHIRDSRQNRILHHGTEQRIGREVFGALGEFRRPISAAVAHVLVLMAFEREPAALFEQEHQRGVFFDVHLPVISGRNQCASTVREALGQFGRGSQRGLNGGSRQTAHFGQHRVQEQQAVVSEQSLE